MKTKWIYFSIICAITLIMFVFVKCKKDENKTATPSTYAKFEYEVTHLNDSQALVKFTNKSINASGYSWDFGNGQTSTEAEPTIQYDSVAIYKVKLTCTPKENLYYNKLIDSAFVNTANWIINYSFDDGKFPDGTVLENYDKATPSSSSYAALKDSAWIIRWRDAQFGGYIALGVSYYNPAAQADDWMIFPAIELAPNYMLSWDAMSLTTSGNYPEDYNVYISTTTQDTAGCFANPMLKKVIRESWSPNATVPGSGITTHTINLDSLGYTSGKAYIAFRLVSNDKDRIGIDNIKIYKKN